MSLAQGEVTDVGDIMVLKPLPVLISACGQVRLCDFEVDGWVSSAASFNRPVSVGGVLLAVRYGKRAALALDDLSHIQAGTRRLD